MRILAGAGAWLVGAGAATASSLLAVSLLGQGIADSPGQQLTAASVNRALAREAQEARPPAARAPRPLGTTPPTPRRAASGSSTAQPAQSPQPAIAPSATPASRAPAAPSPSAARGTVLTSQGGTVLAECRAAGAYLMSWSPTQGYEATGVIRGPAATARVGFESDANAVTMVVSCADGVPTASSYTQPNGVGTTDE